MAHEAPFRLTWLGHNSFQLDTPGGRRVLLDPWVESNPACPAEAKKLDRVDVVTISHGHGDHIAGDSQFIGQPNTVVVGTSQTAVKNFFGIVTWPTQIVAYDLGGGRVLDVIPIPGHQSAHIALYDRQTGILLTGDTL